MLGGPCRNHTPAFKSKVALAALGGDKTITELSQQFDVHPHKNSQSKTQLPERSGAVFEGRGRTESPPGDIKAACEDCGADAGE